MKLKGDTIIIALSKGRFHFPMAWQCLLIETFVLLLLLRTRQNIIYFKSD